MQTIIADKTEFEDQISDLNIGLDLENIQSDIERAQKKWLKYALGDALLSILVEEYVDDESSSSASGSSITADGFTEDQFNEAKALAQKAVCFLAISLYIRRGFATIANNMIVTKSGDDQALSYFERQELAQDYLENGLEYIDDLLAYLEANASAFYSWKSSTAYTVYHKYFIKDCATFEQAVNIGSSRRTFKLLTIELDYLENISLPNALNADLITEIRTEIKKSDPVAKFTTLLVHLQKHLAHAAIVRFMRAQRVKIDTNAIIQIETSGDHIDKKYQADRTDVSMKIDFHDDAAQQWMKKTIQYLNSNAASFTNWTDNTTTTTATTFINQSGKTIGL